jgi:aryl-alcohol dehydrogenase-like predicted oxidoreductase
MAEIGLGLAALGRPAYINLGRDLPADRSVAAMRARAHEVLDAAYARGVRYLDAARSYGRSEEFLASWLAARPDVEGVTVGSKWGYTYTANWRLDVDVHEVKDHGVATFDRQLAETRALLGGRLDLYQIHSVTPDSPALADGALHRRLAALVAEGVRIGLSTSGPHQADAIRAALAVRIDGRPLFRAVQATWNPLEPSAGDALAAAHDAGCLVIVKEALANGRLAVDPPAAFAKVDAAPDAVALAAALRQPWVDIVLSGASSVAQLDSNLAAASVAFDSDLLDGLAEPPADYWRRRSALGWN